MSAQWFLFHFNLLLCKTASGTIRQSNGYSDPRSTQNSTSNELDCGSVYSTSTNGTVRPGIFGQQNQMQTVNDSAVSNLSDDQSLGIAFNFKTQTPAKPSAQLTSSVIPPPPPSKSPGFSRSSRTSPPPSSIPVSPVPPVPPPPTPPLSPKQLSPIVPPKPKTQKFPPPPPPHVLSSLSSDGEMGTLTHKNTEEQAFANNELSQVNKQGQLWIFFFLWVRCHFDIAVMHKFLINKTKRWPWIRFSQWYSLGIYLQHKFGINIATLFSFRLSYFFMYRSRSLENNVQVLWCCAWLITLCTPTFRHKTQIIRSTLNSGSIRLYYCSHCS